MTQPHTRRTRGTQLAALAAAVALLGLTACNRADDDSRTVGQKVDNAIDQAQQQADKAKAQAQESTAEIKQEIKQASADAKTAVSDASITASINSELARDQELSALRINVDTSEGRVALKGSAPSLAARERATRLANAVTGVKSVDNQLIVTQG